MPFFFGGELTFGDNENIKSDYFVHSNQLPQASTILGVMRYTILKVNGLLIKNAKDASKNADKRIELIGKGGFSIANPPADGYGVIKSISPVFVEDFRKHVLMPCPVDCGYDVSFTPSAVQGNKDNKAKLLPEVKCTKENKFYDEEKKLLFPYKKYDNWKYWMNEEGLQVQTEEIFADAEQIGIRKGEACEDDKAFYKQTFKTFVKEYEEKDEKTGEIKRRTPHDYEFVFLTDVEDERLKSLTESKEFSDIVQMGGQRSMFRISISRADDQKADIKDWFKDTDTFLSTDKKVVLMSDAYLKQEDWDGFDFVWGESICNRYIVSDTNTPCEGKPKKTEKLYRLLSRGSVIFHNDINKVMIALDSNQHLKQVGLNQYIFNNLK